MLLGLILRGDASRARKVYLWLALPVIAVAFYAIEHRFDASLTMAAVNGFMFDGSENITADRTGVVNAGSTTFRLLLAAFGCVGLALPRGQKLSWKSPVFWAIGSYTLYLGCTVLWSIGPEFSAFKLPVVVVFMVAAFGIAQQANLEELGRMFTVVCVGYILGGVLAEIFLGTFHVFGDYRFAGTTHPNTQAVYGSVACLGATLFRPESKRFSLTTVVVFTIGLACLLLTKSRTSLAAMMIGLIAIQGLRARGKNRIFLVAGAVFALATVILTLSLMGGQQRTRLANAAALGRTDNLRSLTGRLPLWEELLETISESPWIGNGYLAFWTPDRVEYLGDVFQWEIPHGHNMYLDVLIDGGFVGLSFFLMIFLVGLVTSVHHYRITNDRGAAFVFGLLCFALVHGIGESLYKLYGLPNFVLITLLLRFAWSRPDFDVRLDERVTAQPKVSDLAIGGVA